MVVSGCICTPYAGSAVYVRKAFAAQWTEGVAEEDVAVVLMIRRCEQESVKFRDNDDALQAAIAVIITAAAAFWGSL